MRRAKGSVTYRTRALADKLTHVLTAPPVADVLIYDKDGHLIKRLDGLTRREKPLKQ